jgi:hypothetical protein
MPPNTTCRDAVIRNDVASTSPLVQIYASDVHQKVSLTLLRAFALGVWLRTFGSLPNRLQAQSTNFTSFTADFVVPPLPKTYAGQVVYFWPGPATYPTSSFADLRAHPEPTQLPSCWKMENKQGAE